MTTLEADDRPAPQDRGEEVLRVTGLRTTYEFRGVPVPAVQEFSLTVRPGEIVGLVGESGSGKSTVLKSILGMLRPPAEVEADEIVLAGRDLRSLSAEEARRVRGGEMSMIFQDPINSFNPSWTIGSQFRRMLALHRPDLRRSEYDDEILRLLKEVGIDGRGKLGSYPFQFSQGQLQRIMIAVACASRDLKVLLADEPTTSLDVTIEAQVLELLRKLRAQRDLSMVLVTHDLSVVAEMCDRVVVMYAGRVVEVADVYDLFERPQHPYTQQLLKAIPGFPHDGERLYAMRGAVPRLDAEIQGCWFADRCDSKIGDICDTTRPELYQAPDLGTVAACHRVDPAAAAAKERSNS
ncbi:dipeptide ABC transporter ATP-binding protein DppD [Nocardioides gansuensis]|uniref:Dipeptide ABC transporter ATP-binding protein DppD n=1 Tax=Nocardioides gansuensis TaxID=2138300 RepID=A0A2T8F509_9ACTN|nr:ABC transporter ATP-binding protein [Nocardioides gansuensis]PVG80795.1 dipeptide ABC transporter ATP-binding protein DppD [Nocardioides gansuensis]